MSDCCGAVTLTVDKVREFLLIAKEVDNARCKSQLIPVPLSRNTVEIIKARHALLTQNIPPHKAGDILRTSFITSP